MTTCTDQMMLYKILCLKVQASYTYYAHFGVIIFRETAVLFVPSFVCFAAVSLFWSAGKPGDVKVVDFVYVMLVPKSFNIGSC